MMAHVHRTGEYHPTNSSIWGSAVRLSARRQQHALVYRYCECQHLLSPPALAIKQPDSSTGLAQTRPQEGTYDS
jgi:hypothetical protein